MSNTDALVYRCGPNICKAAPDGSGKQRLTTDGKPGGPLYSWVSASADGSRIAEVAYPMVSPNGDPIRMFPISFFVGPNYVVTARDIERSTLDDAWPGDVIGLANAAVLRPTRYVTLPDGGSALEISEEPVDPPPAILDSL